MNSFSVCKVNISGINVVDRTVSAFAMLAQRQRITYKSKAGRMQKPLVGRLESSL